jgi:hypothetical protein
MSWRFWPRTWPDGSRRSSRPTATWTQLHALAWEPGRHRSCARPGYRRATPSVVAPGRRLAAARRRLWAFDVRRAVPLPESRTRLPVGGVGSSAVGARCSVFGSAESSGCEGHPVAGWRRRVVGCGCSVFGSAESSGCEGHPVAGWRRRVVGRGCRCSVGRVLGSPRGTRRADAVAGRRRRVSGRRRSVFGRPSPPVAEGTRLSAAPGGRCRLVAFGVRLAESHCRMAAPATSGKRMAASACRTATPSCRSAASGWCTAGARLALVVRPGTGGVTMSALDRPTSDGQEAIRARPCGRGDLRRGYLTEYRPVQLLQLLSGLDT